MAVVASTRGGYLRAFGAVVECFSDAGDEVEEEEEGFEVEA